MEIVLKLADAITPASKLNVGGGRPGQDCPFRLDPVIKRVLMGIVRNVKDGSVLGIDGIPLKFILRHSEMVICVLLHVLNTRLSLDFYPKCFKIVILYEK